MEVRSGLFFFFFSSVAHTDKSKWGAAQLEMKRKCEIFSAELLHAADIRWAGLRYRRPFVGPQFVQLRYPFLNWLNILSDAHHSSLEKHCYDTNMGSNDHINEENNIHRHYF